jgi:hypothetical protein
MTLTCPAIVAFRALGPPSPECRYLAKLWSHELGRFLPGNHYAHTRDEAIEKAKNSWLNKANAT